MYKNVNFLPLFLAIIPIQSLFIAKNTFSDISELTADILGKESKNCVVLITDKTYSAILTKEFFVTVKGTPFFLIRISKNEDLLSPNYKTVCSLIESRKRGCKFYVIFFAKPIQTERLLIFGDRNRILDSRSNYILIHDYRLFTQRLLYIWKKMINVIFLRQFLTANSKIL